MNILVISDTHGNVGTIQHLMEIYKGEGLNLGLGLGMGLSSVSDVIHLGDHARDMVRYSRSYDGSTAYHITNGNTDPLVEAHKERVIDIGNKRIFITHGHNYSVKSGLDKLIYKAKELQVDACLFGHTHIPTLFTQEDILFLNPGSTVYPYPGTKRGYGLLRISEDGEIGGKLLEYKESAC